MSLNPSAPAIAQLLTERYGSPQPPQTLDNDILRHILRHRSVRAFAPKALPEHTLNTLVAAAQSGSSSSNLQVWSVVAIQDPVHKNKLASWANEQDFIRQAPLFLIWVADLSRNRLVADLPPGVVLDGTDYLESLLLTAVDTAIAAQNAVLAAESLGLGAVYVGAIRSHVQEISQDLKLPPYAFPLFGTAIGYPAQATAEQPLRPRLPQTAVLHQEFYDASAQPQAAAQYDQALDAFWQAQGIQHPRWTSHLASRLGNVAASGDARYQLRATLNALGFPLR